MNDRLVPMNEVLSLVGNLLKDVASKALQPGELFLNCKDCRFNKESIVEPEICLHCMRNYPDKYERKENNG